MAGVNSKDNFTYTFATVNLNGISNTTKINALKAFVYTLGLDIVAFHEVVGACFEYPGI